MAIALLITRRAFSSNGARNIAERGNENVTRQFARKKMLIEQKTGAERDRFAR